MRRSSTMAAVALASLCSAGCRVLLPFGAPPRPGPSWRAVDAMWAAIRNDAERRARFLSERYYVKYCTSGAAPLPFRAHHRVRVALGTRGRQPVIVVNSQRVLPFQHELNKQAPHYHGATLEEQELVFDRRWRLLKRSRWAWSAPLMTSSSAKVPDSVLYGVDSSRVGRCETRIEGRKAIILEDGKVTSTVPFTGELPSYEAVDLLLGAAVDAVKGATIRCQFVPSHVTDTYTVSGGEVQIDGPPGSSVPAIAVKKARFGQTEYIAPWRDTRSSSHGQSGVDLKPATADDYRRALATFVRDFRIRALVDHDGKPVDLPMGLKGLQPRQP